METLPEESWLRLGIKQNLQLAKAALLRRKGLPRYASHSPKQRRSRSKISCPRRKSRSRVATRLGFRGLVTTAGHGTNVWHALRSRRFWAGGVTQMAHGVLDKSFCVTWGRAYVLDKESQSSDQVQWISSQGDRPSFKWLRIKEDA